MKMTIRRNVFETNSSTEHTFTFSLVHKPFGDLKKYYTFKTLKHKIAIISWLFGECYLDDNCATMGWCTFGPYSLDNMPEALGKDVLDELNKLLCGIDGLNAYELKQKIMDAIVEKEQTYYADDNFKYSDYLLPQKAEPYICDDNLTDDMRRTLALKISLLMLCDIGDEYEKEFFKVLRRQTDIDTYIEAMYTFDNRLVMIGKLRKLFEKAAFELTGEKVDDVCREIGYVGIDGLLNDYYDFDVFTDQLKLDTKTNNAFYQSVKKLLADEDTIILAE